jgi:two-component system, cell cycle sensor histidine kinase and response regulator CckA
MKADLRVLFVEDSEDDMLLLIRQLRVGGYEPIFERVDSAEDMRAALNRGPWDVLITDHAMPRFSAMGALDILKEAGIDIPRIIVSGTIGEETAVQIMRAGADDYIMKGNLSRLVPALERELREAEERRRRRRAEEALRESDRRYRTLVENIDLGVTLIDADFTVLMTNQALARLVDSTPEKIVGGLCYQRFAGRGFACDNCPGTRALTTGQMGEAERELTRNDGKVLSLRIQAFPVTGPTGEPTCFIEVVEDITERTRLQDQLQQTARLESIGRLAGGIAHDFNNLLTAMMGYSSVLLQQMGRDDPHREKVLQISCAAERAAALTRQLLAFSRKQVLNMRVLELNPIIAGFQEIMQRLLGEDIDLRPVLAPRLMQTKADPAQIEQILMNLVINARDAIPVHGRVLLETANVTLDEDYARLHAEVRPGPYVMIAVDDNGSGMTPEIRSQIFDPFFTTKELGKGTGLGLSTVYGIVKQHEGHIAVYSEPDRGTTFKIYLPAVLEPAQTAGFQIGAETRPSGTETILIVEDEEIVLRLACDALEMLGYTVLCASSPEAALRTSREHDGRIDLLVTDVVLPEMDGPRLFTKLAPERPDMKVMYVSGYTGDSIVQHGVLDRGVHFLQKPFTLGSLAAGVRAALEERPASSL